MKIDIEQVEVCKHCKGKGFVSKEINEERQRVREAWERCRKEANEHHMFSDADNLHIAKFEDWMRKRGL